MHIESCLVLQNEKIAKDTFRMKLQGKLAQDMKPGQFVNIKIDGFMLRRPISIHSIDSKNEFSIIYKVVGDGTKKLSKQANRTMVDVFGPLGSSYPLHEEVQEVLLIGGGVGVPPLYELAKQYRAMGKQVIVVLGFNDKESVFCKNDFERLGASVYVATMDGTMGVHGTVMDAIQEHHITCDFTYSCGPIPMLRAVEANYQKGYMSFESRMACGMGACMACVAKDKKEENMYHRICKEGPVFPIGKVEY